MNDFSALLRKLRLKADLSQNALAKKAGIDPSYVNRIERGERQPPSVNVIHDIARALDLDEFSANQLLLSAGYAPTALNPQPVAHAGLRLVSDFLDDKSVPLEERDLIEQELELLEQRIRLIRSRRQGEIGDSTRPS